MFTVDPVAHLLLNRANVQLPRAAPQSHVSLAPALHNQEARRQRVGEFAGGPRRVVHVSRGAFNPGLPS